MLQLLILALVLGFFLWIVMQPWMPLDSRVKTVICAFTIMIFVIYVLLVLLGDAAPPNIQIGR